MQIKATGEGDPPPRPMTVVTGGSDGIGLAIAQRFAAKGHDLLLVARDRERLRAAAASLSAGDAVRVHTLALDLTSADAPQCLEAELDRLGAFADVVVNCAGMGLSGSFDSHSPQAIDALIALNVSAPTRLMRHFAPDMRRRRRGGFLNVASLGGYVPGPYQAVYYASKSYLISVSEAVASELSGHGVRVTVVAPGPVATAFHARMGAERSLYRRLVPALRPRTAAWMAVAGFDLGVRLVVPGFVGMFLFVALRLLPHRLGMLLVSVLLKPRGQENRDA